MIEIIDGVKITMSMDTLDLPHIQATYKNYHGLFSIKTGRLIKGNFPSEQVMSVENWVVLNEERLMFQWKLLTYSNKN